MSGGAAWVIIAGMSYVLIVVLVLIVLVIVASLALGRQAYEVDSARDTEYLELEGHWVRYNVIGGGPPVVLVHGWLSSSIVWEQLAGRLAQRFTVYTLDLTGFGESDKPLSGYGVRYGSRLLFAFCAHFGLARASVIGHDIGGDMAIKLASDHPDVVGRVVLVATPANEEQIDLPTPLWAATLPVVGPLFHALGRYVRPVRSMWMKPFVSEPEDLTEDMIEDAASSTPAAMRQTLSVAKREISGGRLARQARIIKAPALVIAGEEDQIVDPQAAGVWARSLSQAEVCLMDECGHMPMIERPGEFNAQVLAFLTGDARYLEYAGRPEERGEAEYEEEPAAGEHIDDNADTQNIPTVPAEGEPPAFGPPPDEPRDSVDGESRKAGSEEAPADERRPIVRRLGEWPSRRRRRPVEPAEDDTVEDDTVEHDQEPEEEEPIARRGRPRREASETTGDVPEVPRDLFDWGSSLDDFQPPPTSRRPRKRDPEEHYEDEGDPDGSSSNGSSGPSDEPRS